MIIWNQFFSQKSVSGPKQKKLTSIPLIRISLGTKFQFKGEVRDFPQKADKNKACYIQSYLPIFFYLSFSVWEIRGFAKGSYAPSNQRFYGILDCTFNVTSFLANIFLRCVLSKQMLQWDIMEHFLNSTIN